MVARCRAIAAPATIDERVGTRDATWQHCRGVYAQLATARADEVIADYIAGGRARRDARIDDRKTAYEDAPGRTLALSAGKSRSNSSLADMHLMLFGLRAPLVAGRSLPRGIHVSRSPALRFKLESSDQAMNPPS